MATKTKDTPPRDALATLTRQIAALQSKPVGALASQYAALAGEPTRSRNRDYLIKRIAFMLQERAFGGLSEAAELKIAELGTSVPLEWRARLAPKLPQADAKEARDPRLPAVGETIEKPYKGKLYKVTARDAGFELDGTTYKTITDVARAITGRHVSGFLFFGLGK